MTQDLMHSVELKQLVRAAYSAIEADSSAVATRLYSAEELASVPEGAVTRALGVNNHIRHADIEPGEVLLDLGCGAGIDSILAAHKTGRTGKVIALDFLPEMLERTAANAEEAGVNNVETLEGEIEDIPLPDDSVDHIISNGVINLAPRKMRALFECARVLKPGGKLCVSDLTIDESELPTEVLRHPAAWAG